MSRRTIHTIHNIAVVLRLAGASGRDLLAGISHYAREKCHWRMTIFDGADYTPEALVKALGSGRYDGIITSESATDESMASLAALGLPLVFIGWHGDVSRMPQVARVAFVRNDDEDIGCFGARHLRSLGRFRTFGFVRANPRTYWALLREKGFRTELAKSGEKPTLMKLSVSARDPAGLEPITRWLMDMPKPAAIMASYDELAVLVLDACREAALEVPHQVAVIGVDNDALLCDFSTPPLSSIYPNHLREGEMAAAELMRLLSGPKMKSARPRFAVCREKTMIERESSVTIAPAAHLVEEALRFIKRNAERAITVDDVIRHLRVSRRLADLRFREFGVTTLADTIRSVRLERVAERLRTTDLPIGKIASACSYDNLQHLANAFKRHYGVTMTGYRNEYSYHQR